MAVMGGVMINPVLPIAIMIPVTIAMLAGFIIGAIRRQGSRRRRIISVMTGVLVCACIFTMNLRIMRLSDAGDAERPALDVLFVVDSTISMWADDYGQKAYRMDGVKDTIDYIMEDMKGCSFALVSFDTKSSIRLPLTQDAQCISDAMGSLYPPSEYLAKGSSMNVPHDDMKRMLDHMGTEKGHKRIVFFFSDGEITNGEKLMSYKDLSGSIDGGAVLGYGTSKGANMQDLDGSDVYDPDTYDRAVSKIDEETLQTVAGDLGVSYLHVKDKKDVKDIVSAELLSAKNVSEKVEGTFNYEDTYYYLLPLLMFALLAEFVLFME